MSLRPVGPVVAAALTLTACVSQEPVLLRAHEAPASDAAPERPPLRSSKAEADVCRVSIAEVRDARPDPAMGGMGLRAVHAADPVAWARGGLDALKTNDGMAVVPDGAPTDIALKIEIVKAYIQEVNAAKSATVVLRVTFSTGAAEPRIYRGDHSSVNWTGADGEIQGAMDRALNLAVTRIGADIHDICAAAKGHA